MGIHRSESHEPQQDRPPSQERVPVAADKILKHLETLGKLVSVREVADAQSLIICIKQHHGSVSEHREWVAAGNAPLLQQWIKHQNEIVRIGLDIEKIQDGKAHYLVENFADGRRIAPEVPHQREEQEKIFRRAGYESLVTMNMARTVANAGPGIADQYLQSQMGMSRLMVNLVTQNPEAAKRIHGLEYPERATYVSTRHRLRIVGDIAGLQTSGAEDYRRMNALAAQQLRTHLKSGECGVIVLGGSHFAAGTDINGLLRYDDTPRNITELMLDTTLQQLPELHDTTIAVMEPANYPK